MAKAQNRLENLRNLQVANLDVAFSTAFGTLVSGSLLIGFIQSLGGGDLWISLSAAIPALIGLAQIPGAIWGRSFPYYKRFIAPGGFAWRLLYIPVAALPLLVWISNDIRLALLMLCIGLASLTVQIVNPIYNDWIAEMVPANSRGWYFSRRTLISTAVGAGVGLMGGLVMDAFKVADLRQAGFAVVFGLGVACGMVSMVFFLRMEDMPREAPVRPDFREMMRQLVSPAKDRNFVLFLAFTVIYATSQGFAGQFYAAYALEKLDLGYSVIQLFGVSHTISTILFVKMWGFLADRYGNKPILILLVAGTVLTPLLWLLTHPGQTAYNITILLLGHLFNGFVWSGVGVSQFNMAMTTSAPKDRPNYLAAVSAVTALALGISPLLGSWALTTFRGSMSAEAAFKLVFLIVVGIRVVAVLALIPVKEPGSNSLREAVRQMSRVRPRGVLALRRISRSPDAAQREEAIAEVAASGMDLGSDELLRALNDPSPRVRRRASAALAKIANPEIGRRLIRHLQTHPTLAEEEALEALGECGLPEAAETLVSFLDDPRATLRRSAAKALGSLGSQAAIPDLREAAAQTGDPDVRRAAIQALRILEAREATKEIGDALFDAHPSIRTAAAEAVSELELTELAETLRESIEWFEDQTSSEMAYALGVVGDVDDLPEILHTASLSRNPSLRRRCLMGAARLLGVESEFYRLIALDQIGRDEAVLKLMKPLAKSAPAAEVALELYASNQEAEALSALADGFPTAELRHLAERPIEEAFLVAALAAAQMPESGQRRPGQ